MKIQELLERYTLSGIPHEGEGAGAGGGDNKGAGGGDNKGDAGGDNKGAGGGDNKGAGGEYSGPWFGDPKYAIADDVKPFIAAKNPPDLNVVLRSYQETERLLRDRNVMARPDPENMAKWEGHEILGWKPNLDEFKLADPANLPQGTTISEGLREAVREAAHKNYVPLKSAQAVFDGMYEYMVKMQQEVQTEGAATLKEVSTALKQKWGPETNRKLDVARRAMEYLEVDQALSSQLEAFLDSAPAVVELMARIGEAIPEEMLVDSGGGGGDRGIATSVDGINAEINAFKANADKMKAMRDAQHPQHAGVKAEFEKLTARLAAAEAQANQRRR